MTGPFAAEVPQGDANLIARAAQLIIPSQDAPLSLVKNIPVAAGLGGGSSDAATALKILAQHWEKPLPNLPKILTLGADLPVCLNGQPAAFVSGIGECVQKLTAPLPLIYLVLVNPNISLSTRDVYQGTMIADAPSLPSPPSFQSVTDFAHWLNQQRNDLEKPAITRCPEIEKILNSLSWCRNCLCARMSGSGATCFGIFPNEATAKTSASQIQQAQPNWWVTQTALIRSPRRTFSVA